MIAPTSPPVTADVRCADDGRREWIRSLTGADAVNGIDYVEIDPTNPRRLVVVFIRKIESGLQLEPDRIRVDTADGLRGRKVRVLTVELCAKSDPLRDDCLGVTLDCGPDDGLYRLCIVADERASEGSPIFESHLVLDPLASCADFRGDAGGALDRDCLIEVPCEPAVVDMPAIDYLARDYAAVRRSILDRLALTVPDWDESHVPDIGMTVVEALAYTADRLAYFQDAVGTEAFLATARRRTSVRRHVRLIDHQLHEGTNARAWVVVGTDTEVGPLPMNEVFFTTAPPSVTPLRRALRSDDLRTVPPESYEVFEPLAAEPGATLIFLPDLSEIQIHTWGDSNCCLPAGSTSATLVLGAAASVLVAGSVLLFEEVLGPITGLSRDADPTHRHVVRLTADARHVTDVLRPDVALVEVRWSVDDALPFELCLSMTTAPPACRPIHNSSVVRGNVVLVDHGRRLPPEVIGRTTRPGDSADCESGACPPEEAGDSAPIRPTLQRRPIVFAEPLATGRPATVALRQDPALALPALVVGGLRFNDVRNEPSSASEASDELGAAIDALVSMVQRLAASPDGSDVPLTTNRDWADWSVDVLKRHLPLDLQEDVAAGGAPSAGRLRDLERAIRRILRAWVARTDLLASGPEDAHLTVECEDDGRATIRFGDGELGAPPTTGELLFARYRIGGGLRGNVGADAIRQMVLRAGALDGVDIGVRNPLPASGGIAPETVDHARRHAPAAPGRSLERAITATDYATLARRDFARDVQGATAALDWTGSWFEASIALDQRGRADASKDLCDAVEVRLERYRRMGHDLVVGPAVGIPITIRLRVCVAPDVLRGHVRARLDDAFSGRSLPDGNRGLFHPDLSVAGMPVRSSHLVTAALKVEGVISASVETLQRTGRLPSGELEAGILNVGAREIAVVEEGGVSFVLEGGR